MEGGAEAPSPATDMFSLAGLGAALRAVPETPDAASLSYLQLPWQRERRVCKMPSHRRRRAARLHRKVGPMGKEIHGEGLGAARGEGLLPWSGAHGGGGTAALLTAPGTEGSLRENGSGHPGSCQPPKRGWERQREVAPALCTLTTE